MYMFYVFWYYTKKHFYLNNSHDFWKHLSILNSDAYRWLSVAIEDFIESIENYR